MRASHVFAAFFILLSDCGLKVVFGKTESFVYDITSMQIIEKYGYPAESHLIETEDGYIIQVQRIPYGKNSTNKTPGIPVLIIHGLFGLSNTFFILGEASLPFLAADRGYDVWLGSFRGNIYGRMHRKMSPRSNNFWDFSFHESGMYDLPAHIDYICNSTEYDSIFFVTYSMGSTAFFVMASMRQDYQEKIRAATMMAPAATATGLKTAAVALGPFSDFVQVVSDVLRTGAHAKNNTLIKKLSKILCNTLLTKWQVCAKVPFVLAEGNNITFKEDVLAKHMNRLRFTASVKTVIHFFQIARSGKFQQFDYGRSTNYLKYGSYEPPEYDLESITTPMFLFIAPGDRFALKEDNDFLIKRLPNVKSVSVVRSKRFGHLDFFLRKDADTLVYKKILDQIENFLNEEKVDDEIQKLVADFLTKFQALMNNPFGAPGK